MIVLSLLFGAATAMWSHSHVVGISCGEAASGLIPGCGTEEYDCLCGSSLYIYAVQSCIGRETGYQSTQMGEAYDSFIRQQCYLHNAFPNALDAFSPANVQSNVTVSQSLYDKAYIGEYNNLHQKDQAVWLGLGLVFYWAALIALVSVRRLAINISIRLVHNRSVMQKPCYPLIWFQRYILIPALFSDRHVVRFKIFGGWLQFGFATRFETIVVLIYLLLMIIFMLTPYSLHDNDPLFQSKWKEMMRYSSDRAGIMATIQIPLFVLFAMRNNVLIWLTGWSYSSFNVYHRALARICYGLLIVHAVTKHIFSASYHGSLTKYYYPVPYFRFGVSALGLMSIMVAVGSMRGKFYRVFYWLHVSCALGALIMSIFHLVGIGWQEPLWICLAVWITDLVLRFGRILLFNFCFLLSPLHGSRSTTFATMRVFNEDTVSVQVTLPVRWKYEPGQYVYLHTKWWLLLGGNPFSVVGKSEEGEGLELLCRAREGVTKSLCRKLVARGCEPKYPVTLPLWIEGPYGQGAPVERYDEGLIIAGGIGITGVLGYVEKMAHSSRYGEIPKRVTLVWTIRKMNDIDPVVWRLSKLKQMPGVEICIYCRSPREHVWYTDPLNQITGGYNDLESQNPSKFSHHIPESNNYSPTRRTSEDSTEVNPFHDRNISEIYVSQREIQQRFQEPHFIQSGLADRMVDRNGSSVTLPEPLEFTQLEKVFGGSSETPNYIQRLEAAKSEIYPIARAGRADIHSLVKDHIYHAEGSIGVIGCGPDKMMDALNQAVCAYLDGAEHGRVDYYEEAYTW